MNVLQADQECMASSVSNCKPRGLQRCTARFMWQCSTLLPRVVGNREVVPPAWQCAATYITICQRIFVSTSNRCIATCVIFSIFVTLQSFLNFMTEQALKGHRYNDSDNRDKTALQHSSKCFAGLLQRPQEMLEAVYWCRKKLFQRRPLAPECKYTAFLLIPPISQLSGHTFHTNTVLSTDINIHSNVVNTNKAPTNIQESK